MGGIVSVALALDLRASDKAMLSGHLYDLFQVSIFADLIFPFQSILSVSVNIKSTHNILQAVRLACCVFPSAILEQGFHL